MRPRAEILTIGNELLRGSTLNTNARFLGKELTALGLEVIQQSSCRDELDEIKDALAVSLERADLLILSGGLGPTPDDVTRDAVAAYFNVPLKFSSRQYQFIENYYKKRKRKVPAIVRKEAMFPANSEPLFNHYGIALGFSICHKGKWIVALPGVPQELEKMYDALVKPLIKKGICNLPKREKLIVKTVGMSEPGVMHSLGKDFFDDPFDFGIYPDLGEVAVRIYADSPKVIKRLSSKVKKRLDKSVYAYEEKTLSQAAGELLKKQKKSIAIAESCTGGLLASHITQVPGAGKYFRGSITVYQIKVKHWLGVSADIIKKQGVVSAEVAKELAKKIKQEFDSDYGIGITGVAGPKKEGGAPVGTVYISIAGPKTTRVWKENFLGDRNQIQMKAVKKTLEYLWRWLAVK